MTENHATPVAPDEAENELRPHAAWMCGGLAAASFAGILTIIGGDLHTTPYQLATLLFSLGLGPMLLYVWVHRDNTNHKFTDGVSNYAIFGVIASLAGLVFMLWGYRWWIGFSFLVATAITAILLLRAERKPLK